MFNESDSFYFSETFDLTNSIQKQYSVNYDHKKFLWQRVDDRFFWNFHMTKEIRETFKENEVMLLLHTHMTKEIRETFKENEVMLLLHTHMNKEIRETFKENEVMLLLHMHMTKEIRETFKENEVMLLLHTLYLVDHDD